MTDTESIILDKGIQADLFGGTWEVESQRKGRVIRPTLDDYAKENKLQEVEK